jgi:hypothetical protein
MPDGGVNERPPDGATQSDRAGCADATVKEDEPYYARLPKSSLTCTVTARFAWQNERAESFFSVWRNASACPYRPTSQAINGFRQFQDHLNLRGSESCCITAVGVAATSRVTGLRVNGEPYT